MGSPGMEFILFLATGRYPKDGLKVAGTGLIMRE